MADHSTVEAEPGRKGGELRAGRAFYRGDQANFNPTADDYRGPSFLEDRVLRGWLPAERVISAGTRVTAFGSCFAANITRHLTAIGFDLSSNRDPDIYISRMGDGLVNTYALLGQFEWALENKQQPVDLWHGFKAEGYGYDEDIRVRTRDVMLGTEFFIITVGLSEIWYDEPTGGVFWRAVPEERFDPSRHKFRVSSFEETKANIARIYSLVRQHVPQAKVLFTLSPIPLAATFRAASCISANFASKAILRAALDEFMRDNESDVNQRLFYFPSYEIVQQLFLQPWQGNMRHLSEEVIAAITKTFEAVFCQTPTTLADANAFFQTARNNNIRHTLEREALAANVKARSRDEQVEERRAHVEASRAAKEQRKAVKRQRRGETGSGSQGLRGARDA